MKFNLIIDGNYLLNKNVFILNKNKMLYGLLHESLINTITTFSNYYQFDNIFLVSDKGSWRKGVFSDYKANRVKNTDIDWEFVMTTYDEVKSDLPKKINKLEGSYIEGDDWIYKLVKDTNKIGHSNLIITNDRDINQLVDLDLNLNYINIVSNEMWNAEKIFLPNNYELYLSSINETISNMDIFNFDYTSELYDFVRNYINKREINIVFGKEVIVKKIISGDKSDNIKSCYVKESKSGRMMGIGDKGAEKIMDIYYREYGDMDIDDEDFYDNLADIVCEVKKISNANIESISTRLKENMEIINFDFIPDDIINRMDEKIKDIRIK